MHCACPEVTFYAHRSQQGFLRTQVPKMAFPPFLYRQWYFTRSGQKGHLNNTGLEGAHYALGFHMGVLRAQAPKGDFTGAGGPNRGHFTCPCPKRADYATMLKTDILRDQARQAIPPVQIQGILHDQGPKENITPHAPQWIVTIACS